MGRITDMLSNDEITALRGRDWESVNPSSDEITEFTECMNKIIHKLAKMNALGWDMSLYQLWLSMLSELATVGETDIEAQIAVIKAATGVRYSETVLRALLESIGRFEVNFNFIVDICELMAIADTELSDATQLNIMSVGDLGGIQNWNIYKAVYDALLQHPSVLRLLWFGLPIRYSGMTMFFKQIFGEYTIASCLALEDNETVAGTMFFVEQTPRITLTALCGVFAMCWFTERNDIMSTGKRMALWEVALPLSEMEKAIENGALGYTKEEAYTGRYRYPAVVEACHILSRIIKGGTVVEDGHLWTVDEVCKGLARLGLSAEKLYQTVYDTLDLKFVSRVYLNPYAEGITFCWVYPYIVGMLSDTISGRLPLLFERLATSAKVSLSLDGIRILLEHTLAKNLEVLGLSAEEEKSFDIGLSQLPVSALGVEYIDADVAKKCEIIYSMFGVPVEELLKYEEEEPYRSIIESIILPDGKSD